MKIEVSNLKRHFGQTRAVDDVSFDFASGEVVGFIGPNGAGKTTLMRIMATLDDPDDGDITIDGMSIAAQPERARRLVGFMPDDLPNHRDVTVDHYLDFFARAYGIRQPRRQGAIRQIEQFTNLTGLRHRRINELSKGMKQRVSLARAIIHEPALLVLDEPAAGLDPRARIEVRELIRTLGHRGKAVLVSSHILSDLAEICDSAVIIEQGRIVAAGRIDEIAAAAAAHTGEGGEQGAADSGGVAITLRALDGVETLRDAVMTLPGVREARIVGDAVEVDLDGGPEQTAALIAALVQRGVRLVDCRQRRAQLEELFLKVTSGDVS